MPIRHAPLFYAVPEADGTALIERKEKVQAHNNLIERTYKLEERTELQEEKIKVANHRIEDLERALRDQ